MTRRSLLYFEEDDSDDNEEKEETKIHDEIREEDNEEWDGKDRRDDDRRSRRERRKGVERGSWADFSLHVEEKVYNFAMSKVTFLPERFRSGFLKATAIGTLALAAGIAGIWASYSSGNEIYDGKIDEVRVKYTEDKGFFWERRNELIFWRKGTRFTLIDSNDRHGIEWKVDTEGELPFEKDKIEEFVVKTKKGEYHLTEDKIGDGTNEGNHAEKGLRIGNKEYRDARLEIRGKLRNEYAERTERTYEAFDGFTRKMTSGRE